MSNELDIKDLLQAGAHFGHQTEKWNPKMKKYVYGAKNGVYIIDLSKTINLAKKAYDFLKKNSSSGKTVLFVGCKRQAREVMKSVAEECGAFYVTHRWLGGMLTNYKTIAQSIDKLRKVEKMKESGDFTLLTKKEQGRINKEVEKLERNLGGIKNMRKLPGALFIVDPNHERIAILEANNLGIPVVAITDTNCDPTGIDYVVPGNDDAIKSITTFAKYFASAVAEGGAKVPRESSADDVRDVSLEREILEKYERDIELQGEDEVVAEPEVE